MCACLCVCQTLDTSSTQHRHTLANRCWSPRAPRRPHYIMRRSAHDCRYFDSTLPPLFLSAHHLCLYPISPAPSHLIWPTQMTGTAKGDARETGAPRTQPHHLNMPNLTLPQPHRARGHGLVAPHTHKEQTLTRTCTHV